MILVSIKNPEEIPWFRASRRAIVAAIFAGVGDINFCYESIYAAPDLSWLENAPRRSDAGRKHPEPRCLFLDSRPLF